MPLLDNVIQEPTASDGASRIRQQLRESVADLAATLLEANKTVQRHGRQAITAELGSDAAELQTVYNKLKICLQDIDASRSVPDLPS